MRLPKSWPQDMHAQCESTRLAFAQVLAMTAVCEGCGQDHRMEAAETIAGAVLVQCLALMIFTSLPDEVEVVEEVSERAE